MTELRSFCKQRLLQNALLCFDMLSMSGRNYNDFKMATVRPEPFGKLRRALSKGVFLFVFCKKLNRTEFEMARNTNPRGVNHDR